MTARSLTAIVVVVAALLVFWGVMSAPKPRQDEHYVREACEALTKGRLDKTAEQCVEDHYESEKFKANLREVEKK